MLTVSRIWAFFLFFDHTYIACIKVRYRANESVLRYLHFSIITERVSTSEQAKFDY